MKKITTLTLALATIGLSLAGCSNTGTTSTTQSTAASNRGTAGGSQGGTDNNLTNSRIRQ